MYFPKKMVIGFLNFPKICQVPDDKGILPRSIEGGLVKLLSLALGFEYTFAMPVDKTWGNAAPGGNSTGLIGMVQRGEVDIGVCFMAISAARQEVVDFSDWYFSNELTFATHHPKLLPRTLIYTLPFKWMTWISIVSTVVLVSIIMSMLSGFKESPAKLLFELYANILNQSSGSLQRRKPVVLVVCWWAFVLVISFSYKAVVHSFLAVPLRSTPLENFEELSNAVMTGEYRSVGPASIIQSMFLKSNKTHLVALANAMEKNGGFLSLSEYNNDDNIKENTAIISSRILLNFRFGKPPLSTMNIAQNSEIGMNFRLGMAVNKNFCCLHALNRALKRIIQGGLYYKLLNDEGFRSWISASKVSKQEDSEQLITLGDISGALVVLITGILLATLVLIFEIMVFNRKHNYIFMKYIFKKM